MRWQFEVRSPFYRGSFNSGPRAKWAGHENQDKIFWKTDPKNLFIVAQNRRMRKDFTGLNLSSLKQAYIVLQRFLKLTKLHFNDGFIFILSLQTFVVAKLKKKEG